MCNLHGNAVLDGIPHSLPRGDTTAPSFFSFSRCPRRGSHFLHSLIGIVLVIFAPSVSANENHVLALEEALSLASQDQPQVEALDLQARAALEAGRAERELPDPKLAFGIQNLPATGSDSFRLDRDEMTMLSVGVMQDIVTRDKRKAASSRMASEAARLTAEAELGRRAIRREAALAWLDAYGAQQRALALRKLTVEMTAQREVRADALAAGKGGASDVLALDTEISTLRDRLIVAQRDEARARAALSRWIGEHALRPLPEHLPRDRLAHAKVKSATDDVLDIHPAVVSAERAIDVARREADRARAERRPDWRWQLMYGQRQDFPDMVSLQVTIGLPWNRADRQDRRIAQKLAEASAARSEMLDRRRQLSAELDAARADLRASTARLREHEAHLLPAARARLDTAESAYAGGRGTLLAVWQARRALVDVSLHHEMILADGLRAQAQVEWLVGAPELAP